MTKSERDLEIAQLQKAARSHAKSRDEHQKNIDEIEDQIEELRSMPVEADVDIQRWDYGDGGRGLKPFDFGNYCLYQDVVELVNRLKTESAQKPKYEEGKVFFSLEHEKVFILTGGIAKEGDYAWYYTNRLDYNGYAGGHPKAKIIDTTVYEYGNDRYIWNGERTRVPKHGEVYLVRVHNQFITRRCDQNKIATVATGKRRILTKLTEVN